MPSLDEVLAAVPRWRRASRFGRPTRLVFDDEPLADLARGVAGEGQGQDDPMPPPPDELTGELASLLTDEPERYGELEGVLSRGEMEALLSATDGLAARERVSLALVLAYWFEGQGRHDDAQAQWGRLETVVRVDCDGDYPLWQAMYEEVPRRAVDFWEAGAATRDPERWSWLANLAAAVEQVLVGDAGAHCGPPRSGSEGLLTESLDGLFQFAKMMHAEGHHPQVERLRRQILAVGVSEAVAGAGHPCTGICLRALAMPVCLPHWPDQRGTYHEQGTAASLPLYRDEARIMEAALGPTHLLVSDSLNNLGSCLYRLGQLAEAEEALSRSIAIGPPVPHPYRWLALVYQQRGAPGDPERELDLWQRYQEAGPASYRVEEMRARMAELTSRLPGGTGSEEWNRLR